VRQRRSIFKRCSRCGGRVPERRCPKCGGDKFTWAYVVDVAAPGAKRKQRMQSGFATKGAADAALARLQTERADGEYVEPSKRTVGQYLTDWVKAGCGGVRPWTLRGYETAVRVHIIPRLGSVLLQALTRAQIKSMYANLLVNGYSGRVTAAQQAQLEEVARRVRSTELRGVRQTVRALAEELGRPEATVRHWVRRCHELGLLGNGAMKPPRGRGLSPKSVWNVHICLRAALNDAIEDELLKVNPARGAMKEPTDRPEMVTWTVEELQTFLGYVKDDRNFALYRLAAYSGMRRGELLGLRRQDLKLDLGIVSIQQQLGLNEDEEGEFDDALVLAPVKTRSSRRAIKVDKLTREALRTHLQAQEFERRSWGPTYHDHDLVFCRPDGLPHDPDTISDQFERLERRAGLKRIRFHDLRHTHATLLLEAHVDVTVVSKRLGHASVKTTADRYVHVTDRLQQDAAERFSALLDAPRAEPAAGDEHGAAQ